MAGPVAAARTSLPTYPPGHSGSSPQAAAPPPPLLPSSQLVTAPTPQSASGKPRLPVQLAPSMLPDSSVGFSAPPSLLSLAPFLLAARVDPSTPAGQTQSRAHFPPAPAPPGPRTQPLSAVACRDLYSVPTVSPASMSRTCCFLCLEYSSLPPLASLTATSPLRLSLLPPGRLP